jgi:hypothetical protein
MRVISFEEYKHKKFGASASPPAPSASIRARRARILKATRALHEAARKQNEIVQEFLAVTSALKGKIKNSKKAVSFSTATSGGLGSSAYAGRQTNSSIRWTRCCRPKGLDR